MVSDKQVEPRDTHSALLPSTLLQAGQQQAGWQARSRLSSKAPGTMPVEHHAMPVPVHS